MKDHAYSWVAVISRADHFEFLQVRFPTRRARVRGLTSFEYGTDNRFTNLILSRRLDTRGGVRTRLIKSEVVGVTGFEPATPASRIALGALFRQSVSNDFLPDQYLSKSVVIHN